MDSAARANDFLRQNRMEPAAMDVPGLMDELQREMTRGLRSEASSLGMYPAYLQINGQAERNTPVLVIDAGGTNLRLARLHLDRDGKPVTEALVKTRMPGTAGETDAETFFATLAALALPLSEGCTRGCFCFSYPCEVLPDGDGQVVRLTKELRVRQLVGSRICAPLEAALRRLGAPGARRWRVINDTVGAMLCGMAELGAESYDDFVGFILGTGTNSCCCVRGDKIAKSPAAMAMGGDVIVNLESGGFSRFPRGVADERLDALSDCRGLQWAEKAISGAYFPALLRLTLQLAAEQGYLSGATLPEFGMAELGELCEEREDDLFARALGAERPFTRAVTLLLLDRGARLSAAVLGGVIASRGLAAGSRVCVCADGTTFARNPVLRPAVADYLYRYITLPLGVSVDFFGVSDATLLGTAYAGLLK